MIIANPIYDVVFKRMMENDRVAKFFLSTLLNQTIESVEVKPQEFTYVNEFTGLTVFRLDFIATVKTETGEYKKILIEIQKAKNQIDLMGFRNYLAEQYKKEDVVNNEKMALPITTIYILGFKLKNIESACIKVERQYKDLINNTLLGEKSDFVEKLTHDSYVVQAERITNRYKSKLDKLLSVFQQAYFIDDKQITKDYPHIVDMEEVKIMTKILHHSGTDPESRKLIEKEQEAWRTVNALFADKEKKFTKALEEKEMEINEKEQALLEKEQVLLEKEQALNEKDRIIEELKRQLGKD